MGLTGKEKGAPNLQKGGWFDNSWVDRWHWDDDVTEICAFLIYILCIYRIFFSCIVVSLN